MTLTFATSRALVIGVDHYPGVHADLSGCVNDALAVRSFLVDRVHVSETNLLLLLSAVAPHPTACAPPADAAHIRAAFAELVTSARPGDHVVVYLAGHGVRIRNQATGERAYGFVPTDTAFDVTGFANLVLDREINACLRRIGAAGATITVLADTCHSGGATRELARVRHLPSVSLSPADWCTFVAAHPILEPPLPARTANRGPSEERGWLGVGDDSDDWVTLSACRDTEAAKEVRVPAPHGAFTFSLLEALRRVPPDAVLGLRWMDLMPAVRSAMRRLVSDQTALLEGRPEKAVFGGGWAPFEPGFTACPGPSVGELSLDGGSLHGLDVGAIVALYPPGTASFEQAEGAGAVVHATIVAAAPATSTARLLDPTAAVAEGARARLSHPSPEIMPLGVLLTEVPADVVRAIARVRGATERLELTSDNDRAGVEVRPWTGATPAWSDVDPPAWVGARGGWVIVPYAPDRVTSAPDEVIAYLPPLGAPGAGDAGRLGEALGRGLLHWARYLDVLHRTHADPMLAGMIEVALRVGEDKETAARRSPGASGVYEVTDSEPLWIEIRARTTQRRRLFAGVLACSNDGNVIVTWPEDGADPALAAQSVLVGRSRFEPAYPQVRRDQTSSLYTFKVVATTRSHGSEPPRLGSLGQAATVQEVIEETFTRGALSAGGGPGEMAPARHLWCTWDLPVRARRAVT
ncbi:caspase family protein [Sorangium sp. So ce117]|uniref:caspase family protein n=1 Tax=Sorangium sp. So ce117 TaxID=3133277 RepID=UPI003F601D60